MAERILLVIIGVAMLLSACSWGQKPAASKPENPIIKILDVLGNENAEELKGIFAKNAIANAKTIDEDINILFQYYSGNVVSLNNPCGGADESISYEDDHIKEEKYWTYDVTTSECAYRITFHEVTKDTKTPDNVGLWSISIIKMEDDTNPEYAYWGDGEFTPGINIGVKNVLPTVIDN